MTDSSCDDDDDDDERGISRISNRNNDKDYHMIGDSSCDGDEVGL